MDQRNQLATSVQHKQIFDFKILGVQNYKFVCKHLQGFQILPNFHPKTGWPLWSTDRSGLVVHGTRHVNYVVCQYTVNGQRFKLRSWSSHKATTIALPGRFCPMFLLLPNSIIVKALARLYRVGFARCFDPYLICASIGCTG